MWFVRGDSCLKQAYGEWLASLPWDLFLTVTFRDQVPMRRQETVVHAVGQSIKSRFETLDRLALFAEPHRSTTTGEPLQHNLHLHGLVDVGESEGVLNHVRVAMQAYLSDKFGRSQAAFPRGRSAVSKYVAKYCVKTDGYYELW